MAASYMSLFPHAFPAATACSLPSDFTGVDITDYLESFEDAVDDFHITDDNQIYSRWLRWCERDTKEVVKALWEDLGGTPTWGDLKTVMKAQWKYLDPRQLDNPIVNVRKFYSTPLGPTADEINKGLTKLSSLIAKVPKDSRQPIVDGATNGFLQMLDTEVKAALGNTHGQSPEDLEALPWPKFKVHLINVLRNGFYTTGGKFTRLAKRDLTKTETKTETKSKAKPSTLAPAPEVTILKRQTSVDDLAAKVRKLTLLMEKNQEPEHLKTYLQQTIPTPEIIVDNYRPQFPAHNQYSGAGGGSLDGRVYNTGRNAYTQGNGYFVSNESIANGNPRAVPLLNPNLDRNGRPMAGRACHGCGDPSHRCWASSCPEYGALEHFNIAFLRNTFLYITRLPASPETYPDPDYMVHPSLVRQACNAGALWQLVVAIYQRFGDRLGTYPEFNEYMIKRERTSFVASPAFLLINGREPPWILQGAEFQAQHAKNQTQPMAITKANEEVRTSICRLEDRGKPLFQYLSEGDVRVVSYPKDEHTWIQRAFSNDAAISSTEPDESRCQLTTMNVTTGVPLKPDEHAKTILTPSDDGRSSAPPPPSPLITEPGSGDNDDIRQLITTFMDSLVQEIDARKRPRLEDEPMTDIRPQAPADTMAGRPAPIQPSSRPIAQPKPSHKKAATSIPTGLVHSLSQKPTEESAISEIIASIMCKTVPVPLRQLMALNQNLVHAMQTFLDAQQKVSEVVTLEDTAIPDKPYVPREGERPTVVTNLQQIQVPDDRVAHEALPFFATLANGELALMNADVLREYLNRKNKGSTRQDSELLDVPISHLTLTQKAKMVLATRYHHLPRLFLHLADQDTKVCAVLDTGSECNLIPRSIVENRGIAWTPTAAVSVGLHGKETFFGESIANVWLGDHVVKTHFFVLDDRDRKYNLILGMPFIRDTKLTFDYMESGSIRAKLLLDDKLILASCFQPEFSKATA